MTVLPTYMLERRTFVLLIACAASIPLSLAQDAPGKTQPKATDNKIVLEGKVIDDQVVDERGKLIAGATVVGIYTLVDSRQSFTLDKATTSRDGSFKLPREKLPLILEARTPDGRQVGIARVEANQQDVTICVSPTARATGQLVDRNGIPVMLGFINRGIRIPETEPASLFTYFSRSEAILDSEGRFTLTGLVPGERYQISYTPQGDHASSTNLTVVNPLSAREIDLGKLSFAPSPRNSNARLRIEATDVLQVAQRQQEISKLLDAALTDTPYDLVVKRVPGTNLSTNTLPYEFSGTLMQIPGVQTIQRGVLDVTLIDLIDFQDDGLTGVTIAGWWPNRCPLFARFKFEPGGRKLQVGDDSTAVLGRDLATKLKKKVGDTIVLYGSEKFQVVGIYESPIEFENRGLVVPLKGLQRASGLPQEVTGIAITAERPIDEQGLEDLRQRLEAVQPGLEVTNLNQKK